MAYVVAARWTAKPGEVDRIRKALETYVPLCREEPDVLQYQAHVSVDDPSTFLIYEQYTGPEGLALHREMPHFKEHVVGYAVNYLQHREVMIYETLD